MTERKKDGLLLVGLLTLFIILFAKILFTHQIVRAPDIINEFYWAVKDTSARSFWSLFRVDLASAGWDLHINSGFTTEGGGVSSQFLFFRNLVLWLFPSPANIAWYMVLHLFFGAVGAYYFCRLIGTSRVAAVLAGLVFALAPEHASLINAGHVMKIATISFTPWVFYFFEKGFKTRRLFWFLTTALVLTYQFFHTHWQIAFYTCLAVAIYGIARTVAIIRTEKASGKESARLFGLNVALLLFFLTSVAISLAPLANWSKDTNRGAATVASVGAAAQSKGGLNRDEAMAWSLPPEELGAFIIPGFFGTSRQEAGENPKNITAYYWGRMNFSQTLSYMGLLPWLLVPLPLIFRRDRYTWLATAAIVLGVLFSMGKYTLFYNLLFDHFPGINRFRVPKMMMFIPVLGLGVLGALGLDLLLDEKVRQTKAFRRYLTGIGILPAALLVLLGIEAFGKGYWIQTFIDQLGQPTRYEQTSEQLIVQRYVNLMVETGFAAGLAALFATTFFLYQRGKLSAKLLPVVLLALFLIDVSRVNAKFMFLVDPPHRESAAKTPDISYLLNQSKQFRTLPMAGDPMPYAAAGIPVMFTSNAVQQRRWQDYLDNFNLASAMPDILNVRYLVEPKGQAAQDVATLKGKFAPVFTSPDGGTVILESRTVLPKAWLTPTAIPVDNPQNLLTALQNPAFNPRVFALVESPPPIPLADFRAQAYPDPGRAQVTRYEGDRIDVDADAAVNAMLVLGEKYYRGWRATVDGKPSEIYPVDYVLRGIYLPAGKHKVSFVFDPVPFKIGKRLTLASFAFFLLMLAREVRFRRQGSLSV
ncbi:YfhO family protein [Geomesophilobacter sediminis]|uniref:YfhO family protein n=1 Tax=Geomesophilobacter sediminis TaxID=2798584 RepID=A0A8J7M1Q3_9BACT|nr:YfhO family protein [Geomesophilobacter sediminis]MBJ6727037.1 YfhO family protein [Geomesophilobacter sediminis]